MKTTTLLITLFYSAFLNAQTISGKFSKCPKQALKLQGYSGLTTYSIASSYLDDQGNFTLNYSKADYGVGCLLSADEKPLFVILSGEDIVILGESLSAVEALKITKGHENQLLEQYAFEHPRREQALSAWIYLEKIYKLDPLFSVQRASIKNIQTEKERIKREDAKFLSNLPTNSYVQWFLPTRKLVSSVATIAQYRTEEMSNTIAAFRALDYADLKLYKSGLFKEALESHFWLLENSGKSLDSVYIEMKLSIDAMMPNLIKNEKIFNEAATYLFDLLERHSLLQASEYLAIKVLNESSCTLNSDLAKQLESYRSMKKGNIAPEINFGGGTYLNGFQQSQFTNLESLKTPFTLVVFGASWCPKCSEEIPKIIQNYVKWRNLGMEILYISLDTDQKAFEQRVKEYPFFAYCDYKKWESQVVKDYHVFGTPTMYLLNQKREIVVRPNSASQVDAWVDWFLLKGQN